MIWRSLDINGLKDGRGFTCIWIEVNKGCFVILVRLFDEKKRGILTVKLVVGEKA